MEAQLPLLGLIMGVLGLAGTVWWRIQTHVSSVRTELEARIQAVSAQTSLTSMQLADYRTYVAEHYISKQGFRETMESLNHTLQTISNNMARQNERLDRFIDNQPPRAPSRSEASS